MLKSHSCGELRKDHIGEEVTLAGWVHRRRDHGGLVFIDLRDRGGIVQVVFNPEVAKAACNVADELRSEYVIRVTGEVIQRPAGTQNQKLATGEIEVIVSDAQILNTSKTTPFYINEDVEVDENLLSKCPYCGTRVKKIISWCHAAIIDPSPEYTITEKKITEYEKKGFHSHAAEMADKYSHKIKDDLLKERALENYKKAGYDLDSTPGSGE